MKGMEGNIHGGQVKDLITKFFYRDNFLCFQILLQMTGGEIVLFREFTDYAEYKKIFSDLQRVKNSDAFIDIPKSNLKNMSATIKVA